MTIDIVLSPAGRLSVRSTADEGRNGERPLRDVREAFSRSNGEGLFALAADRLDPALPPSFGYWRGFAALYLDRVRQTPLGVEAALEPITLPGDAQMASLILNVPPMPGGEYVSRERLGMLWQELDAWFRDAVESSQLGLSEFLEQRAPLWHQVGRVCFHLAENRRDEGCPFAFLATYAPTVTGGGRLQYQPLSKALQQSMGEKNKQTLIKLLSPIHAASKSSEVVRELVETGDLYHALAWTPADAYRFLKEVPQMEAAGIVIRVPDWWKKRPRPRVGITIGEQRKESLDTSSLLDFRLQVALGDEELSEDEWEALLDGEDGLVLLRGQWVEVDREKLSEALDHWKEVEAQATDGLSFTDGMRLLAGAPADLGDDSLDVTQQEWSFVDAGGWLGGVLADLRDPANMDAMRRIQGLKATLREYQKAGVNWLATLSRLGLGACLADDMGLGKTIQVLALLLLLKSRKVEKPSLLVLPASLLANWKSEIERFAPSLRACFVHPSQTGKDDLAAMAEDPRAGLKGCDVVLTTYGMLLRQSWLRDIEWEIAVLDEAQAIKNPSARQTKAVKQLTTSSRIALTGTPVENRLGDLWSLFDFLCPGLLGSPGKFKKFIKSLEARSDDRYAPLRRLVSPYILRRLKTDKRVIIDLPEKTEVRAFCGLTKRQAALYAKLVKELRTAVQGKDGIKRRGLVLAYLMRFKQLCNHPSHLLGDGDYGAKESGKFLRLIEICEEIATRQEKALVFTQFREMAEPLSDVLAGVFGRTGLVLHGGTAVGRRKKLVDEFQRAGGPPYFVLSLKAGGTGLNLTEASHVIHFDRWWNPAVENQATDRAFRIGQQRNVLVHKFVCQGTVEERIDGLISEKTELATEVLQGGAEKLLTEMTDSELIAMVSLDVDRVEFQG